MSGACRGSSIHRSAWKKNSRKFTVAINHSDAAESTRQQHGGIPSASKRSDLVAVVAPFCIKELRLVTVQLPEKFLGRRTAAMDHPRELRNDGVLGSSPCYTLEPGVNVVLWAYVYRCMSIGVRL